MPANRQVACATATAVQIIPPAGTAQVVTLVNNATNPIFLGDDPTVTSSTGLLLAAAATLTLELSAGQALWGISTGGAQTVTCFARQKANAA
jgi:hypothetical protein